MVELLTASTSASAEWNEHDKDVTASEHYQEKLKAYQTGSIYMLHSIVVHA